MQEPRYFPRVSPISAGLRCRCPRCGRGRLFAGYLDVAPLCTVCGLDLTKADSGDGPAVFLIFVLGFLVVPLALFVEVLFTPPLWVHLAIWPVAILGGALGLLRSFKGVLIALQYHHKASEGGSEDYD